MESVGFGTFLRGFQFSPEARVGVELEGLVVDRHGRAVPEAAAVIDAALDPEHIGCELSACQIEVRTSPLIHVAQLRTELTSRIEQVRTAAHSCGFRVVFCPVGPEDMPLDVSNDEEGRYAAIAERLGEERLRAACRSMGVHIHCGATNHRDLMRAYNLLAQKYEHLCGAGDLSRGERIKLYRLVAGPSNPPRYHDWMAYHRAACERGFANNPRNCWDLVRLSRHGTAEVRVFDSTDDVDRIVGWAVRCHAISR